MVFDEHHSSHTAPQENFTVLAARFNAREYGSCAERERWWAVILVCRPVIPLRSVRSTIRFCRVRRLGRTR